MEVSPDKKGFILIHEDTFNVILLFSYDLNRLATHSDHEALVILISLWIYRRLKSHTFTRASWGAKLAPSVWGRTFRRRVRWTRGLVRVRTISCANRTLIIRLTVITRGPARFFWLRGNWRQFWAPHLWGKSMSVVIIVRVVVWLVVIKIFSSIIRHCSLITLLN